MLKILTNKSVKATINNLEDDFLDRIEGCYYAGTTTDDRFEFKLEQFHRDLVTEIAYRQGGNWDELEASWILPDDTYEKFLEAMHKAGYCIQLEKW